MGHWIDFTSHVTIGTHSFTNGVLREISYQDIGEEQIREICGNKKIKTIQINKQLPDEAFEIIDQLLCIRPDITFRIWNLVGNNTFDLDILNRMENLTRLRLDGYLVDAQGVVNPEKLCNITKLKELSLDLFDLKDYGFLKHLNPELESLLIMADTLRGTPVFDCRWLLEYPKLRELWLGKKARKHLECIAELPALVKLSIRGIKINDFHFLKDSNIEALSVLWCSIGNFDSIQVLNKLKYLELWRIPKLEDISAISKLEMLEVLKLQDLSHITTLPDIRNLKHFKEIKLINTPIDENMIPNEIKISGW